jgi:hypothetical protein
LFIFCADDMDIFEPNSEVGEESWFVRVFYQELKTEMILAIQRSKTSRGRLDYYNAQV